MTFAKFFAILQIMKSPEQQKEIRLLMERAGQMLIVAEHNLAENFYESSVNRSYYAVFYAATAVLTTKQIAMSRHAGVISTFRKEFVKSGVFDIEYSDIYGRLLNHREISDYDLLVSLDQEQATQDLQDARRFVAVVQTWLEREHWL
jgi:uncharacterized protein (UPF0332 family)